MPRHKNNWAQKTNKTLGIRTQSKDNRRQTPSQTPSAVPSSFSATEDWGLTTALRRLLASWSLPGLSQREAHVGDFRLRQGKAGARQATHRLLRAGCWASRSLRAPQLLPLSSHHLCQKHLSGFHFPNWIQKWFRFQTLESSNPNYKITLT